MPRQAATNPSVDLQAALKAAAAQLKASEKKDATIQKLTDKIAKLESKGAAAKAAPVAGKRGRPAKAPQLIEVPVSKRVKAADVGTTPAKRGRPAKTESAPVADAPKRRGRPPKAEAAAAVVKKAASTAKVAPKAKKTVESDDYLL